MSGTLIVAGAGDAGAPELVGAAKALGGDVTALVIGAGARDVAGRIDVTRALVADDPSLSDYMAERYLPVVVAAVEQAQPDVVLFPHTLDWRELAPRAAFRLGAGLVTDCVALRREGDELLLTKPVYGGSVLAEYAISTTPAMATLRPRAFPAVEAGSGTADIAELRVEAPTAPRTKLVERSQAAATSGPGLKDAKVVVSGGRGLGGPENWHHVEELAQALGAAIGASRAVTDAGWVPAALQVGLTGTTVNPDLYVAIGISGAVQHMAGCSGARSLVAINRDPEANIFKHARFGVVGDYKEIVPALTARVKELRG